MEGKDSHLSLSNGSSDSTSEDGGNGKSLEDGELHIEDECWNCCDDCLVYLMLLSLKRKRRRP